MNQPKIGLLPLYLELYDVAMPELRRGAEAFLQKVMAALRTRNVDVLATPLRRTREEFEGAIRLFEDAKVDTIVTLHLAYSPSLECIEALASTKLPIIVLDSTPGYACTPSTDPAEMMYNHGIHGVQDMCSMLLRRSKPFWVEAGHWEKSDVLDRVASWARAAKLSVQIRQARVGRIGEPFEGMGDFAVPENILKAKIGIQTVPCDIGELASLLPSADDEEVLAEIKSDGGKFSSVGISVSAHTQAARAGLAVRRWIRKRKLTAFTMNFLAFDGASGIPTVPFLEASKAMSRRTGYAGEGDVLTAGFIGALASVYPGTTFAEMFCPDWEHNRICVSHMGEMNLSLASGTPVLVQRPFPWTDAEDPVVAVASFRGGRAALANLAPGPDDTFTLTVAPVSMIEVTGEDKMSESIRGWFEPELPVSDFLAEFSRAGGTHHSALVYGELADEIARFGELMGWRVATLGKGH